MTPDLLDFAGIEPVAVPAIPLSLQVAEKLHAYTRRYEGDRPSSRTKDLIDLALIAQLFSLDASAVRSDLKRVFESRGTHELPAALPDPPATWRVPYRQLAVEVGIDADLDAGHAAAAALLNPILEDRDASGLWDPTARRWSS